MHRAIVHLLLLFYYGGATSIEFFPPRLDTTAAANHLTTLALDDTHIYVGARNALYQLSPELQLERHHPTGPHSDSADCSARASCQASAVRRSTNQFAKALVIDREARQLILCGSLFQGACTRHRLGNISEEIVMPHREPVAANDERTSTGTLFL